MINIDSNVTYNTIRKIYCLLGYSNLSINSKFLQGVTSQNHRKFLLDCIKIISSQTIDQTCEDFILFLFCCCCFVVFFSFLFFIFYLFVFVFCLFIFLNFFCVSLARSCPWPNGYWSSVVSVRLLSVLLNTISCIHLAICNYHRLISYETVLYFDSLLLTLHYGNFLSWKF